MNEWMCEKVYNTLVYVLKGLLLFNIQVQWSQVNNLC
jgi:hypothetical protein